MLLLPCEHKCIHVNLRIFRRLCYTFEQSSLFFFVVVILTRYNQLNCAIGGPR
ncbi:hypothetical protein Peur_042519 [Populus x canadensis]